MKTNNPMAFALLQEGKTIEFHDYQTGVKLPDNFEGIVRVYIGGVVDAIMRTTIDHRDGKRSWFQVKADQSRSN